MGTAIPDGTLTAFWVSFPDDATFPLGLGITAWSKADACGLQESAADPGVAGDLVLAYARNQAAE
jgi:hypothetical protein